MSLHDPSGVLFTYTDTNTDTSPTCNDSSSPTSDSDSNGSFNYCPNDPDSYTDSAFPSDFLLAAPDTDYVDFLDDTSNTDYVDYGGGSQQGGRKGRIRLRRLNGPFWRHIRNLYKKNQREEAIQEMLNWYAHHPVNH
jgi:hypothetical protein